MSQSDSPKGGSSEAKAIAPKTAEEIAAASEKAEAALAEAADAVKEIEAAADSAASEVEAQALENASPADESVSETETFDAEVEPVEAQIDEHDDAAPEPIEDHDHEEHDEQHGSLASKALTYLVVALVVASLTLWAAPKIAPHVPAGVAQYLAPASVGDKERIAALEARLAEQSTATEEQISGLKEQLSGLAEIEAMVAGATGSAMADLNAAIDAAKSDAETARAEADSLTRKVTALEAALEQSQAEVQALAAAMAERGDAGPVVVGATPEDLQKIEEQRAADAALRNAEIAALAARVDALTGRVVEAETETAAAQEARNAALSQVEDAVRAAELRGSAAALESRLASGEGFSGALSDVETLSGSTAPEALKAGAQSGFATPRSLANGFSPVARRALAADVQASSDGTTQGRVLTWLQSQVAGRPTVETAGDDVGAVLSRVGARLDEGDAAAALAETQTLPEHSRAAMGGWLEQLQGRVAAEQALSTWLDDIGVNG